MSRERVPLSSSPRTRTELERRRTVRVAKRGRVGLVRVSRKVSLSENSKVATSQQQSRSKRKAAWLHSPPREIRERFERFELWFCFVESLFSKDACAGALRDRDGSREDFTAEFVERGRDVRARLFNSLGSISKFGILASFETWQVFFEIRKNLWHFVWQNSFETDTHLEKESGQRSLSPLTE